jgi:hypothetical protein
MKSMGDVVQASKIYIEAIKSIPKEDALRKI